MKDTIYREDAIKAINARTDWYQVTCNGKQIAVMLMAKDVNETLEKVPSADRPQGEWIRYDSMEDKFDDIRCSCCQRLFTVDAYHFTDIGFTEDDLNFCPNCGARMKGADDDLLQTT